MARARAPGLLGGFFGTQSLAGGSFPFTPWGQFKPNATVSGDRPLLFGPGVRVGLSLVGCVAGAALLARLGRRLRAGAWQEPLTLFTAVHVLMLLVPFTLFDRYLIVLLPGALYLATDPRPEACAARTMGWRPRRTAGLVTLAVFGLFSLGLLHDWLSWNAARWALGRRALERGIHASDIEGGFEWEGWYSGAQAPPKPRGVWALSFSVRNGTQAVDREPYDLWLIPGQRDFYLLQQLPPGGSVP